MKNKIKTRVLSYLSAISFHWVMKYLDLVSKIDLIVVLHFKPNVSIQGRTKWRKPRAGTGYVGRIFTAWDKNWVLTYPAACWQPKRPTKLVVRSFWGRSTVPPLHSSLLQSIKICFWENQFSCKITLNIITFIFSIWKSLNPFEISQEYSKKEREKTVAVWPQMIMQHENGHPGSDLGKSRLASTGSWYLFWRSNCNFMHFIFYEIFLIINYLYPNIFLRSTLSYYLKNV